MISDYFQKVKQWVGENRNDLYVAVLIFLVSLASFGLGRLSVLWPKKEPIRIENIETGLPEAVSEKSAAFPNSAEPQIQKFSERKYVASKNGAAYHYPWCPGAQKIKEENKIWFRDKAEAEKAGYKPAGNCEGL